jgi:hypothetical protein
LPPLAPKTTVSDAPGVPLGVQLVVVEALPVPDQVYVAIVYHSVRVFVLST